MRMTAMTKHMPAPYRRVIPQDPCQCPEARLAIEDTFEFGAVVLIVSATGTDVVDDVNVIVVALKLQVLCGGKVEHADGERGAEPVSPFCAVNVIIVDPDWPGLAMFIVVGLAVIENVPPTLTEETAEVEPV